MHKIDRIFNKIERLPANTFTELGFTERKHLQEWLVGCPESLGEELLIIQKEFSGFDDTRERLDVLALDKNGQLVIIENKLDDSGKDVVWQALKYAAYCSSLTTQQIIEIFDSYLQLHCKNDSLKANEIVSEFLDGANMEEAVLNEGNRQRIMLVAANFRKEVTSTVMWLLSHEIYVQCFKVTPYSLGDELILDLKQIIPIPEAEDFMIGISNKEKSEAAVKGAKNRSQRVRYEFWAQALDALRNAGFERYKNISAPNEHWLSCGTGVSVANYKLIFLQSELKVELTLGSPDKQINKQLFDAIFANRESIEKQFGHELIWRRMDENKSSKIVYSNTFDSFNRENWSEMIDWLVEYRRRLEESFDRPLREAVNKSK